MTDLYEKTITKLTESKIPLMQVAAGSNVGYRWLCRLIAGDYSDPGVKKIQRIHNYLSTEKINDA